MTPTDKERITELEQKVSALEMGAEERKEALSWVIYYSFHCTQETLNNFPSAAKKLLNEYRGGAREDTP